jgi:hypothetical protein
MTFFPTRPRAVERSIRALEQELRDLDRRGAMQARPGAQEERALIEAAIAVAKTLASPHPTRRAA